MAGITGTALYLLFNGVAINTDYRSFSPSEEVGLVDQSAGADTARTYLSTLTDGTASTPFVLQADDTTTWGALALKTEGTLEWGEEGTAAGKPRHYVNAIVQGRNKDISYADVIIATVAWQYSGAVTDTTY